MNHILPLLLLLAVAPSAAAIPPYAEAALSEQPSVVPIDEDPFSWELEPVILPAGGGGVLIATLHVPEGHVVYRDQVEVRAIEVGPVVAAEAVLPPGTLAADPVSEADLREQYTHDVRVEIPLTAPDDFEGGVAATVSLRHQGCRNGLCFPPVTVSREVLVVVRRGDATEPSE